MTENEYTNEQLIDFMYDVMDWRDVVDQPMIYAVIEELKEIQQNRAIGTIEEFKAYKLGDCMNDCEHYENCSNYIYSKGYNKAIDDFVKEIEAEYDNDACPNVSDYLDYKISIRDLFTIADQLKGGAV